MVALPKHLTPRSYLRHSPKLLCRAYRGGKDVLWQKQGGLFFFFEASAETVLGHQSWQACQAEKRHSPFSSLVPSQLRPAVLKKAGWELVTNCYKWWGNCCTASRRAGHTSLAAAPPALPHPLLESTSRLQLAEVTAGSICLSLPTSCLLAPLAQGIGGFEVTCKNDPCFLCLKKCSQGNAIT